MTDLTPAPPPTQAPPPTDDGEEDDNDDGGDEDDPDHDAFLDCGACADFDRDCLADTFDEYMGTCDEGFYAMHGCYCDMDCPHGEHHFGCFIDGIPVGGAWRFG